MKSLLTALLLSAAAFAAESIPQPITELKLTNGSVFRNVTIVRYDPTTVVLKSSAGTGPISYAMIPEPLRSAMEPRRRLAERIGKAIREKTLIPGMSRDEAVKSWGQPERKNTSGGAGRASHEQWVYSHDGGTVYVYFEDGALTSWQRSEVTR